MGSNHFSSMYVVLVHLSNDKILYKEKNSRYRLNSDNLLCNLGSGLVRILGS